MKRLCTLFLLFIIISCAEDPSNLYDPVSPQQKETDFEFVLRVQHSQQEVEFLKPDGNVHLTSFKGHATAWDDGRANGRLTLGNREDGDIILFHASRTECVDDRLVVNLIGEIQHLFNKRVIETHGVVAVVASNAGSDNPDCVIWEIKDACPAHSGIFEGNGRIYFANSECSER